MENKKNEIMNLDVSTISNEVKKNENFLEKVILNVEKIKAFYPGEFKEEDLEDYEILEEKSIELRNFVSKDSAELKNERLILTRKLNEITKIFTNSENSVIEEMKPVDTFISNLTKFKLHLREIENEKRQAIISENNRVQNLRNDITSYYTSLVDKVYLSLKSIIENGYYSQTLEQIPEYFEYLKMLNFEKVLETFNADFSKEFYKVSEKDNEIHAEIYKSFASKIEEKVSQIVETIDYLIDFYPQRIEALKKIKNDAELKAKEEEKLKAKQLEEEEKLKAKQLEEENNRIKEQAINSVIQNVELPKEEISLAKGTSVKLKYAPANHSELIEIIKWYIANEFSSLDFETILKRLSFMITPANRELNKGNEIKGVSTVEDVVIRKTK